MKKTAILISSIFCAAAAFAQSVESLGFSPKVARPNEPVQYTIVLKGADAEISPSDIPAPAALRYAGTSTQSRISFSNVSGKSRERRLSFTFVPGAEGEFTIPAWKLSAGGKTFEIPEAKLKVDKSAPQSIPQADDDDFFGAFSAFGNPAMRQMQAMRSMMSNNRPQSAERIDLNNETSLEAVLPKGEIYVGEAVPVELRAKFSKKIARAGYSISELMPKLKSGDSFQTRGFNKKFDYNENPGKDYVEISIFTTLIPLKAGVHALQFELDAQISPSDPFGGFGLFGDSRRFSVPMPEQKIDVKELPKEGMPKSFSGAIGDFKIDSAALDETSLSVGEPCILTVKISGEGNFERVQPPALANSGGWKDYKPKVSFAEEGDSAGARGVKTFEFTILPKKPDLKTAPEVEFSYFDPSQKAYKVLKPAPIEVSVAPSKGYAKAKREKENDSGANPLASVGGKSSPFSAQSMASKPVFWAVQALVLGAFAAFFVSKSRRNKLMLDPKYARKSAAQKALKKAMRSAEASASKSDAAGFFKSAETALKAALSASGDIDYAAITLSDAQKILAQKPHCAELEPRVRYFFEGADAVAFAGLNPGAGELGGLCKELDLICKKILKD